MIKLLPCPFCGGERAVGYDFDGAFVECAICGALTDHYFTLDAAIAAWNRRATPPYMATPINHVELVNLGFLDAGIDGFYYLAVNDARIQVMLYADGRTEVEIAESGNCDTVSMPGATKVGHLLDLIAMLERVES